MSNERILLPEFGAIKNKEGKTVWGRTPYTFLFTNKETYIIWRKVWKETYKELSVQIREAKITRNNGFRNKVENTYSLQYEVLKKKEMARCLMSILEEGKALSYAMKNAASGK